MPLTTAHPIIIAPLWHLGRRWFDLPALIVGTMIPDIKYFLHLRTMENIGHSALGILIQGIPLSLCLLAIFGLVMLGPLRALWPGGFGRILPVTYTFLPAQRFAIIVTSIVIGAVSHVFWDSFTHDGWFFVRRIPLLDMQIGPLPVYKYVQYASGVFGTAAVIVWAIWAARPMPADLPRIANRTIPLCIIIATAAVTLYFALGKNNPLTPYIVLIQSTIGLIAGTFLGLLLFSVIDRLRPFARLSTKP